MSGAPAAGLEGAATVLAKGLAEVSRDSVADLRALRYRLEGELSEVLSSRENHEVEPILADIVELSSVCGRAADEARAAARAGLWVWRTDDAAYHAQRQMLDPTLPRRSSSERGAERHWFLTFDAGVRQCRQTEQMLVEETHLLQGLLTAASTIAVTRDAKAQETFNTVVTIGGTLISVPALIIALYGASAVLPITLSRPAVLWPMVIGALLAVGLVTLLPGMGGSRATRFFGSLAAVAVIMGLLYYAGHAVEPPS